MAARRRALSLFTALVLAALWAPIGVMVAFSFNESKYAARFTGFTLDWYRQLAADHEIRDALWNTLAIAGMSTVLATGVGTVAALAARRAFRGKRLYATLVALPLMVPDIVLAVALLAFFRAIHVGGSIYTAALAHTTFGLSYVAVIVSARLQGLDPDMERAARDLGATRLGAFLHVTFPAILPAVVGGALLAFTLSFDDFVLTYFTAGHDATLPVKVFSMVRVGVNPKINAISTLVLAASLLLIVVALRFSARDLRLAEEGSS